MWHFQKSITWLVRFCLSHRAETVESGVLTAARVNHKMSDSYIRRSCTAVSARVSGRHYVHLSQTAKRWTELSELKSMVNMEVPLLYFFIKTYYFNKNKFNYFYCSPGMSPVVAVCIIWVYWENDPHLHLSVNTANNFLMSLWAQSPFWSLLNITLSVFCNFWPC